MKSDVTIENMEETLHKMSIYREDIDKEFRDIVKNSSNNISSKAKSNVNVVTGNMRNSIKPKFFRKGGPAATVLPRKSQHRHLVEYGTTTRYHKSGKFVGWARPKPFMQPAEDSERPNYERQVRKLVDKVVTI